VSAESCRCTWIWALLFLKLARKRASAAGFSLEGSRRAELRTQRRASRARWGDFEVISPGKLAPLLPALQAISDSWLQEKAAAEKASRSVPSPRSM